MDDRVEEYRHPESDPAQDQPQHQRESQAARWWGKVVLPAAVVARSKQALTLLAEVSQNQSRRLPLADWEIQWQSGGRQLLTSLRVLDPELAKREDWPAGGSHRARLPCLPL